MLETFKKLANLGIDSLKAKDYLTLALVVLIVWHYIDYGNFKEAKKTIIVLNEKIEKKDDAHAKELADNNVYWQKRIDKQDDDCEEERKQDKLAMLLEKDKQIDRLDRGKRNPDWDGLKKQINGNTTLIQQSKTLDSINQKKR